MLFSFTFKFFKFICYFLLSKQRARNKIKIFPLRQPNLYKKKTKLNFKKIKNKKNLNKKNIPESMYDKKM